MDVLLVAGDRPEYNISVVSLDRSLANKLCSRKRSYSNSDNTMQGGRKIVLSGDAEVDLPITH